MSEFTSVSPTLVPVNVVRVKKAADGIVCLELRAADGSDLPAFEAGAHVDVHLPSGLVRQYSLCNDPAERDRFVLGVGRAVNGRGGSEEVHRLQEGARLEVSEPRNLFPLVSTTWPVLFVAGGIGVTPIRAMIFEAQRRGLDWHLLYAARSQETAAFAAEFANQWPGRMTPFFAPQPQTADGELCRRVMSVSQETEVYCCGPAGLMDLVRQAATGRPAEKVHFESFGAAPPRADDGSFDIRLHGSSEVIHIPPDRSILEVLREKGIECASACESGICGACESKVIEGVPDHRDSCLSEEQHRSGRCMTICVSRARTPMLVLQVPC